MVCVHTSTLHGVRMLFDFGLIGRSWKRSEYVYDPGGQPIRRAFKTGGGHARQSIPRLRAGRHNVNRLWADSGHDQGRGKSKVIPTSQRVERSLDQLHTDATQS
jgi:hypothetical protein